MTTEDRRLIAALTTEVMEQRAVIVKLAAEYARVCDMFQMQPTTHREYRDALAVLR